MTATPYVCGQVRHSQGRAPIGWVSPRFASGDRTATPWFCDPLCLAVWLVQQTDAPPPNHQTSESAVPGRLCRGRGLGAVGRVLRPAKVRPVPLSRPELCDGSPGVLAHAHQLHDIAHTAVDDQMAADIASRPDPTTPDVAAAALVLHLTRTAGAA